MCSNVGLYRDFKGLKTLSNRVIKYPYFLVIVVAHINYSFFNNQRVFNYSKLILILKLITTSYSYLNSIVVEHVNSVRLDSQFYSI